MPLLVDMLSACLMSARWLDDDDDDNDDERYYYCSFLPRPRRAIEREHFLEKEDRDDDDGDDDNDDDDDDPEEEEEQQQHARAVAQLSHVGRAVYRSLQNSRQHARHRRVLWNVSTGAVVGRFQSTPAGAFDEDRHDAAADPADGHDDWFARALADLVASAGHFCDVLSLREPDGLFLDEFRRAVTLLAAKQQQQQQQQQQRAVECGDDDNKYSQGQEQKCITIRLMFGNVFAWPVDCHRVVQELTRDIVANNKCSTTSIRLWVGAWRKNFSWNHAKIIAVDGRQLHTGGHNYWSQHYLKVNPLHDVSMQLEGAVALDGHRFANRQWAYLIQELANQQYDTAAASLVKPPFQTCCTLASFPSHKADPTMPRFPPMFSVKTSVPLHFREAPFQQPQHVPILTLGKCGCITDSATASSTTRDRPSDDGLVALLNAARHRIQIATQDLGPRCLPVRSVQIPYPGTGWPADTLRALARAVAHRGVTVDVVLANRGAICGGLPASDTLARPNGWTIQHLYDKVAAAVRAECGTTSGSKGRMSHDAATALVRSRLRVCGLRHRRGRSAYQDGTKFGLHAKCYIVDRRAFYIGSQNLYVCDLAEWGAVVDDAATTARLLTEYWNPMWECSWGEEEPA